MVEFSNLKCEITDRDFADFEHCYLKSVNRTYKYFTIKVRLFKVPVTKVKINLGLYQRLNGLKPFLYNVTVDGCKFVKNPRSNRVASYFYDFFRNYSNLDHPCPYDHDLYVDKMSTQYIDHRLTNTLPFPKGSYMFKTDWFVYGIKRAIVSIYLTLS
ncbi:hypothetical protein KR038_012141 [Drosophila bunnanda]|nr:hypothetical protein KR038_012141 [Drosophila bunnanda]